MKLEEWIAACRKHPDRRARYVEGTVYYTLGEIVTLDGIKVCLSSEFELESLPPQTITITREQFRTTWKQWNGRAGVEGLMLLLGFRDEEA